MKKIALLALTACLLIVAGCTTDSSSSGLITDQQMQSKNGNDLAVPLLSGLKMNEPALIQNGSYSFTASIDQLENDTKGPNNHVINIYINVKNTGIKPIQLVWFSKITDASGKSFGGIGISHDGSGAVGTWLSPDFSVTARDFIRIDSDQDYAKLSKGCILEVSFIEQLSNNEQPETFKTAWVINPGYFR